MPQFCPKCGNMVGDGIERCPACGSRMQPRMMDEKTGFTWADFFNYSFVSIFFVLIALLVPLLIGWVCVSLYLR